MFVKMDRKKIVQEEHRFRRGQYKTDEPVHPLGMTEEQVEEGVKFPWERRELGFHQLRDLIAKKPHQQDR